MVTYVTTCFSSPTCNTAAAPELADAMLVAKTTGIAYETVPVIPKVSYHLVPQGVRLQVVWLFKSELTSLLSVGSPGVPLGGVPCT